MPGFAGVCLAALQMGYPSLALLLIPGPARSFSRTAHGLALDKGYLYFLLVLLVASVRRAGQLKVLADYRDELRWAERLRDEILGADHLAAHAVPHAVVP